MWPIIKYDDVHPVQGLTETWGRMVLIYKITLKAVKTAANSFNAETMNERQTKCIECQRGRINIYNNNFPGFFLTIQPQERR